MKQYSTKLLLLGEGACGKTSLTLRYCKGCYTEGYQSTVGVDFQSKDIVLNHKDESYEFRVVVWDLAGQEHFGFLRPNFYKGAKAGLLVYDVTRPVTFSKLGNWVQEVQKGINSYIPIVLIGNKVDIREEEAVKENLHVSTEQGQEYADSLSDWATHITGRKQKVGFVETSAKENLNVEKAFHSCLHQFIENL
jgi:small GTP-binding protein